MHCSNGKSFKYADIIIQQALEIWKGELSLSENVSWDTLAQTMRNSFDYVRTKPEYTADNTMLWIATKVWFEIHQMFGIV